MHLQPRCDRAVRAFHPRVGEHVEVEHAAADECRSPAVLIAWEHCRIPKLRRALGCDTGRCRACWSDLDYDSVDRFRVFTDGGVDVLPPTSEGFGGGETTFLYAMCVDKQGEEPGLDCVPPY